MGLALQPFEFYDNGGGLDVRSSPTKVPENKSSACLNTDYTVDGAARTRYGSSILNIGNQIAASSRTFNSFQYQKSDGTNLIVYFNGTSVYTNEQVPASSLTGLSSYIPDFEQITTGDNEYLVFGNGVDNNKKFDGATWTNLSFAKPTVLAVAQGAAGNMAAGVYSYYLSFARTVAGVIQQESDITDLPVELTIGALTSVTVAIPLSTDAQVNARVLYRRGPTATIYYRIATITDNTSTTYTDNNADEGTIEIETDNQEPPKSAIFEEYQGAMIYVDATNLTDIYVSKVNRPWNVPTNSLVILDGGIRCIKRCFGAIIISTDKSIYVQNGSFEASEPIRFSSGEGILNNNCAVGDTILYALSTSKKLFKITPTDFSQDQMRISDPISDEIGKVFDSISSSGEDNIFMTYYSKANIAKVMISCPTGSSSTNNTLIVFNEQQAIAKQSTCWQVWDNTNASCMLMVSQYNDRSLFGFDYNGYIWRLDDPAHFGDGGEQNGTATAAASTTLTDSTKTFTASIFIGANIKIISGTGAGQARTITANTTTQVTVATWTTTPDTTSVYTIGGYNSYHFTNWKSLGDSYDTLKQLWFIFANLRALGNYTVDLLLQFDFDESEANTTVITWSLASSNTIWGSFTWGTGVWSSTAVFQDRKRRFRRFRAIRVGFRSQKAGLPFELNGVSLYAQNKGILFGTAS